jgi:hypothetical protein
MKRAYLQARKQLFRTLAGLALHFMRQVLSAGEVFGKALMRCLTAAADGLHALKHVFLRSGCFLLQARRQALRPIVGVGLGVPLNMATVLHLRKQAFRLPSFLALHAVRQALTETAAFVFVFCLAD